MSANKMTFSDERSTGGFSVALRGLGSATLAARVEDPKGFDWVPLIHRNHFKHLPELKARDVLPTLRHNRRLWDFVIEQLHHNAIVIIDIAAHTRQLIESVVARFAIPGWGGRNPLDALRDPEVSGEMGKAILNYARLQAVETSTVPRIEELLRLAGASADVPFGNGSYLFDRQALCEMDGREFEQLLAKFAVAFADALHPERQSDALIASLEQRRFLDEGRVAYLALEDVMGIDRVYDEGPREPFAMLQAAHTRIERHLQSSMYATMVRTARRAPGAVMQEDSTKVYGLQAADIAVGIACQEFERQDGNTLAGAQAVRRLFDRVLYNDQWL